MRAGRPDAGAPWVGKERSPYVRANKSRYLNHMPLRVRFGSLVVGGGDADAQ